MPFANSFGRARLLVCQSIYIPLFVLMILSGCCIPSDSLVWDVAFKGNTSGLDSQSGEYGTSVVSIDFLPRWPTGEDVLVMHLNSGVGYVEIVVFGHLHDLGPKVTLNSASDDMQAWITQWDTSNPESFLNMAADQRPKTRATFKMVGSIDLEPVHIKDSGWEIKSMRVDLTTPGLVDTSVFIIPSQSPPRTTGAREIISIKGTFRGRWVRPCRLPI